MPSKTLPFVNFFSIHFFWGRSQPASGAATVLWRHWRSMDPARGRLNWNHGTRHLQAGPGKFVGVLRKKKTNLTRTGRSKHTWCLGFLDQIFLWVWKICSKHGLEKDLFLQVEKKNREGYQCCNSICKVGEIFQLTSATKHPCASPERCRKCPTLTESPKYSVKLCPISIPSSRTTPPVRKCVLCQSDLTSSEHFQNCKPSLSIHDAEQQAGNYTAATTPRISELLVPTIQSRTG